MHEHAWKARARRACSRAAIRYRGVAAAIFASFAGVRLVVGACLATFGAALSTTAAGAFDACAAACNPSRSDVEADAIEASLYSHAKPIEGAIAKLQSVANSNVVFMGASFAVDPPTNLRAREIVVNSIGARTHSAVRP
jgi:hypothetical protein